MKDGAFSETLNVHYTVLYNLFEQSSYLKKKIKNGVGDEKRERERLISSAIMEIKGLPLWLVTDGAKETCSPLTSGTMYP